MLFLKKKNINTYNFNKLQYIYNNFKYILITRFIFLNSTQILQLKKQLKPFQIYIFKKTLFKNLKPLKGQGSIIILYANEIENFNIIKKILLKYKINILFFIKNKELNSFLKMKNLKLSTIYFYQQFTQPFISFLKILKMKNWRI